MDQQPPPPEKPADSDCCGSGCVPCVFDVYEKLKKEWETGGSTTTTTTTTTTDTRKLRRHDLLSTLQYKPYLLLNVDPVNSHTNLYTFQAYDASGTKEVTGRLPYEPGQHFIMKAAAAAANLHLRRASNSISRSYTPVSVAREEIKCEVKFLIKLYEKGEMSAVLSGMRIGDRAHFRGPFGDFIHTPNAKYIAICAGTGIAPIYAIVKSVLQDERDETVIRLSYACATLADVYFRAEIREFCKFWNFTAKVYLSEGGSPLPPPPPPENRVRADERILASKITAEVIGEEVSASASAGGSFKWLICGSEKFNADICAYAEMFGVSKSDMFVF